MGLNDLLAYVWVIIGIISLFLIFRYIYILIFFGNTDIYFGYKSGVNSIKNFLNSIKIDLKAKKNIDTNSKVIFIKEKLRDLSIKKDIDLLNSRINNLKDKGEKNYKFVIGELNKKEKDLLKKIKEELKENKTKNTLKSLDGSRNDIINIINESYLDKIKKSINELTTNLGENLLGIIKLFFAFLLFVGDIYASTKLWQDIYAKEISEGVLYMGIKFEYVGLIIGIFIPLLFFFIFDLILEKSKKGNMGAKMMEYLILFFTFILVISGLFVLFGARILPEIPFNFEPIDVIMILFFIPATLVVAYVWNDLKNGKESLSFIFAPIELILKYIIFGIGSIAKIISNFFYDLFGNKKKKINKINNPKSNIILEKIDLIGIDLDEINLDFVREEEKIINEINILEEKIFNLEKGFEMSINKKINLN